LASAEFKTTVDGERLTITESGAPVAVYQYGMVLPERASQERLRRACYFHPLYSPSGARLTDDFPSDHLHHRGMFWAWPKAMAGERPMDTWTLDGCRQHHESLEVKEATAERVLVEARSVWLFDDAPEKPQLRERVKFAVSSATDTEFTIDFELTLENLSGTDFTLAGETDDDKGYGGFCLRPASAVEVPYLKRQEPEHSPYRFLAQGGAVTEDVLRLESPWCAVDFPTNAETGARGGMAIFQHPSNPGYPHAGWMLRHYGFLGQSWPHLQPHTLAPGARVTLRYRVLLFDGAAAERGIEPRYAAYLRECQTP
jgi:hypothetical protein